MILWRNRITPGPGRTEWMVQYSPDAVKSGGRADNNDRSMWGIGGQWKGSTFSIAAGYDHWPQLYGGTIDAARLAVMNRFGTTTVGLIYESIRHELQTGGVSGLERDACGVNVAVKHRSWRYLAQILAAGDYGDTHKTGAVMYAAGLEQSFDASLKSYLIYTWTDNEEDAAFPGVGGTHGDPLATLPGRTPRALSFGVRYSF